MKCRIVEMPEYGGYGLFLFERNESDTQSCVYQVKESFLAPGIIYPTGDRMKPTLIIDYKYFPFIQKAFIATTDVIDNDIEDCRKVRDTLLALVGHTIRSIKK